MLKLAGATALAIFITIMLFLVFYAMAYWIVKGTFYTIRKIKEEIKK